MQTRTEQRVDNIIRLPDFFIVGAPKCGTTALNHYLNQHPDIFMSQKELHFFGSDLVFAFPRLTKEDYLAYFSSAKTEGKVGEAAVWYLYSSEAAAEIRKLCPAARIIIMLRNPVDVMYSLHRQRLYNGNEDIEDFEAALSAEDHRKCGFSLPRNPSNLMGCFYRNCVKFTSQVRRYLDNFDREKVHIIIYDDFQKDLPGVYQNCCEFLGVDHRFRPDFPIVNARQRVRSQFIRDLMHSPPPWFHFVAKAMKLRDNRQGGYKGWLKRLNTTRSNVPPMDTGLRRRLQEECTAEVEQLSDLLGRDLTHWCNT